MEWGYVFIYLGWRETLKKENWKRGKVWTRIDVLSRWLHHNLLAPCQQINDRVLSMGFVCFFNSLFLIYILALCFVSFKLPTYDDVTEDPPTVILLPLGRKKRLPKHGTLQSAAALLALKGRSLNCQLPLVIERTLCSSVATLAGCSPYIRSGGIDVNSTKTMIIYWLQ